jgi:hypothetical protein
LVVTTKGVAPQDKKQRSVPKALPKTSNKSDNGQEIQLTTLGLAKEDLHNNFYYFIGRKERYECGFIFL